MISNFCELIFIRFNNENGDNWFTIKDVLEYIKLNPPFPLDDYTDTVIEYSIYFALVNAWEVLNIMLF